MNESKIKLEKIKNYHWSKLVLELVVVFLGVTAGFLLNNWQNQRQTFILEKKYLHGFLQDINSNIAELDRAIKTDSLWMKSARPKLLVMKTRTLKPDTANALFKMIVNISRADIQTGTYEDIINSGNLNIINDYKLKKRIVEYHVAVSGVKFIEDYFYRYFNQFVMPFIFSNYNVLKENFDNPEIIKTSKFSNVITEYYSMVQQQMVSYKGLLKNSYDLRNSLRKFDLSD